MPKIVIKFTNISKEMLDEFFDYVVCNNLINDYDSFTKSYIIFLKDEIKSLRDCEQSLIVKSYIRYSKDIVGSITDGVWRDDYFDYISLNARNELLKKFSSNTFDDIISMYFNDVKCEYIKNNSTSELEFIPENRDMFIKTHLKLVISCAKKYRNLGVEFCDLIQSGNEGLIKAFEKFDNCRQTLKQRLIEYVQESHLDKFCYDEASSLINSGIGYENNWTKVVVEKIPEDGFVSKDSFIKWINANIKTATFTSVSQLWIRCYILQSLRKSNQIDIPYDKLSKGYTNFLSLDGMNPITHDDNGEPLLFKYTSDNDKFLVEYDFENADGDEDIEIVKMTNKLLRKLNVVERRVIKRYFGIGLPCPLNKTDIARQELMKISEVKQIIAESLDKIKQSFSEEELNNLYKFIS